MKLLLTLGVLLFSSILSAENIIVSWNPTGANIDGITITHTENGVVQPLIDVLPDTIIYTLTDVVKGVHIFTVEGYKGELKGGQSDPASLLYLDKFIVTIVTTK